MKSSLEIFTWYIQIVSKLDHICEGEISKRLEGIWFYKNSNFLKMRFLNDAIKKIQIF